MESREILLYLALKHEGNWDAIYEEVSSKSEPNTEEAKELFKNLKSKYITLLDDEYPEDLKQAKKPPFVLFYYGDISLLKSKFKLGVVGSRKYSEYGEKCTKSFVNELSKTFVIVSGMALGIDAFAHRSCINAGGRTIAVLGNGIDYCYLDKNIDIYENCKSKNLVISEYPARVLPKPDHFPTRNRIIVGLSDGLLVSEGKIHSGTEITACLMAEKNGNVCCIPTRIDEDSICNYLISSGANLVMTPNDVCEVIGVRPHSCIFEK